METYSKEILPSLRNQGSLKVIYKFRSEIWMGERLGDEQGTIYKNILNWLDSLVVHQPIKNFCILGKLVTEICSQHKIIP